MNGAVWLASYPKSGNTWFRIFLANLLADQPEPVDINQLTTENFAARSTFDRLVGWETGELTPTEILAVRPDVVAEMAEGKEQVFKVHESFREQLSNKPLFSAAATRAALYFLRNPLDVAVSFTHHRNTDQDATIRLMNDPGAAIGVQPLDMVQLPQPLGTWSHHVLSWVDEPGLRVLAVRYEDMLARPLEVFGAACEFAGFPSEPARVARALQHARFETVRAQEQARGFRESVEGRTFFRQGKAGGWRELLSPAQVSAIISSHGEVMRRFGYLNPSGEPV